MKLSCHILRNASPLAPADLRRAFGHFVKRNQRLRHLAKPGAENSPLSGKQCQAPRLGHASHDNHVVNGHPLEDKIGDSDVDVGS